MPLHCSLVSGSAPSLAKIKFGNPSKLDLCKRGSLSPAIFNSDIQLNVFPISCFISVYPFVALLKAMYAENVQIVLSSQY